MFQEWLNHTGVRFKRGRGKLYTNFELEQRRVKTHGGEICSNCQLYYEAIVQGVGTSRGGMVKYILIN